MRRDLFCALSLSGLLLACAHNKANETAANNPRSEAQAETVQAEQHARAERAHDEENGVVRDRDGDGVNDPVVVRDKDGVAVRDKDAVVRDKDGVDVPKRHPERDRVATAGAEVPAHDADNTGINKRDKGGAGLTPLDQGNSEIDIDLTQRIRKAVMADDALSFTAKNVKIITRDGHVTLRGPVKNAQEKLAIGKAANTAAGAAHVTNQIDVEAN